MFAAIGQDEADALGYKGAQDVEKSKKFLIPRAFVPLLRYCW